MSASLLILLAPLCTNIIPVQGSDGPNYDEDLVPRYELPEVLICIDGTQVRTAEDWQKKRRPEVRKLLEESVYGKTPDRRLPGSRFVMHEYGPEALEGLATRKQISLYLTMERQPALHILLYLPNTKKRNPVFLGLNFYGNQTIHSDPAISISTGWMRNNSKLGIENHRATEKSRGIYAHRWQVEKVIRRGYALATVYCGDIDPDNYEHDYSDGVQPLFYKEGQAKPDDHEWGTIGVWAWGLSRVLDYLETDPDIDAERVAVIGHSRLGKTALWAAAQDERFALTISNNSGCGGAALYRRCYGERIHHMLKPVGYWFCKNHAQYAYKENKLPVDQHMLMALLAPRPAYVASATADRWADPKGEFLAAKHATPVYQLFGLEGLPEGPMPAPNRPLHGTLGFHLRRGKHDITAYDWEQYLDFADMHLTE